MNKFEFILLSAFVLIPLGVIYLVLSICAYLGVPLAVIYMILKLCGVIDWNWFFVIGLPLICGFVSAFIVVLMNNWVKK